MAVNAKTEEEEPDLWENGLASDIWYHMSIMQVIRDHNIRTANIDSNLDQ